MVHLMSLLFRFTDVVNDFPQESHFTTVSNREKGIRNEPAKNNIDPCLLMLRE